MKTTSRCLVSAEQAMKLPNLHALNTEKTSNQAGNIDPRGRLSSLTLSEPCFRIAETVLANARQCGTMQAGAIETMKWVKLQKYCNLSGDTANAVHARRKKGVWLDGIHCQVRNNNLWINTEAVEKWVEQGLKNSNAASG